eukprot:CAMPEP_0113846628 /NCGR_PEP_ID=MMETSP0372-20130328/1414_1 /TAXON_ID=340204 /ORGANISM="Lankesteria abbotti" /LENGTH=126 /DNA_ID=CAMNT_0000815795 /DNA_START=519 /DNA_END=899 /DNA_ORIENTATION=+ /assembly_acc=CAM_ASM_000359
MTHDLHTLCLLDIRVKEQTVDNLMKGNDIFEPPKYMDISTAIQQLLFIQNERKSSVCNDETRAFGMARVGADDQIVVSGTLKELQSHESFGDPLHSLVICAPTLHDMEGEFFDALRVTYKTENTTL